MWNCEHTRVSVYSLCGNVKTRGCQKSHYMVVKDTMVSVEPVCGTVKARGVNCATIWICKIAMVSLEPRGRQ